MPVSTPGQNADKAHTARVKDLVGYLYKAVKTILLYPPSNPLPGEFKAQLHDKLSTFVEEYGPLTLAVRGDQFVWDGQTVHEEAGGEDNFIASLTRDGVQKLIFQPGLDIEELDQFLGIVKHVINDRSEDDDLVTLLWEASFAHIKYESINELESVDYQALEQRLLDRQSEAEEHAGAINYGAVVLDEGPVDGEVAEAGSLAASSGLEARTLDAVNVTNIIDDLANIADDLSQVDDYLKEAMQFDPASSTVGIVFEILIAEDEIPGFRETCNIVDLLYDRFIEQADFNSAVRIYAGICELEQAEVDHSPARSGRLGESRLRTADKLRVDQIAAALNAHPGCDIKACRALLQALPVEILPHLVTALGELVHFPPRRLACDILAERGADRVDTIGNGIFDKRWYVIRNVAVVLGNIGGQRAGTYLEKVVGHPDERVRREVIDALIRMEPEHSSSLLRRALDDARFELRVLALQALARRRDTATAESALTRIRSAGFRRLEPTEQKEWLAALARIQGDDSLPVFKKLVGSFALFDRGAKQRLEGLAVAALGEGEGPGILTYLEELSEHKNERIREAAYRTLNRIHNDSAPGSSPA